MAVGFGFSVGDLCVGLKLIKDSIDAVNDTKGSPADYAALVQEISSLQHGLEAAEEIQTDHNLSQKQIVALDNALSACNQSIEEFLTSISKYQPYLHPKASGFHSSYRKIKWALCKKEDVAKFREQLLRHTSLINMLLITFQAKRNMDAGGPDATLSTKIRSEEDRLATMLNDLSLDQRQVFCALMYQNKQLIQSVEEMKTILQVQARVPPQVMLQQPVMLLDPFGKVVPFHLDFIDSAECFMAVLKVRFKNAGITAGGLSKLENGDFFIQETQRRRPINLHKNWSSVFRPGENIDMSMVFHRFACPPNTCPTCLEINEGNDQQTYCQACGLCYQNIQAISKSGWSRQLLDNDIPIAGEEIPYMLRQPGKEPELKVFRPSKASEDEIFQGYRRVQLVSQPLNLLDGKYPALQLIQDFSRFAELLQGVPSETSVHLPTIRHVHACAIQHILRQRSNLPAFASFSQIEQVRESLAKESLDLRRDIDNLVQDLCNDQDTQALMDYIKDKYPSSHGKDYYTGVLTRMANISNFSKSNHAKAKSSERMRWLLLDARSR